VPVYGIPIATVLLIGLFSVLRPDSFPTIINFRVLATGNATLLMLALAATLPMMAGKIDLSFGYGVGLWQVLVLQWQIDGLDWRLAVAFAVIGSAAVGLFNGLLVELARVDSFIATLATGQVLYAISYGVTGGQQITDTHGRRSAMFQDLSTWSVGPIPGVLIIGIVIAAILFVLAEYLPLGRYLYAVGANPRAAELTGISRRKFVMGAFVASGAITGIAAVLLSSQQNGVAQSNIGPDYLLPALTAVFLGTTTIRPGRVNVLGTIVGVVVAVIGIAGLQQLFPGQFFLQPLFNGAVLMAAITLAAFASRHRILKVVAPYLPKVPQPDEESKPTP
jgi:ribose transport system permease protein